MVNIPSPDKLTFNAGVSSDNDPYFFQKIGSGDNHYLKLAINDNSNETFQIWGNACGEKGKCGGLGAMKHKFTAIGDVEHVGTLKAGNGIIINKSKGKGKGKYNIISSDDDWLRINNNDNIGRTAMYGNVSINGTKKGMGGLSVGAWTSNVGEGNIAATGKIIAEKQLCMGDANNRTCIAPSFFRKMVNQYYVNQKNRFTADEMIQLKTLASAFKNFKK